MEELNELRRRRRAELEELRRLGIDPYPYSFHRTHFSRDIIESYRDNEGRKKVSVAGRIMAIRRMGKASFAHLQDSKGRIQIYLRKDDLGTLYDAFRLMDIGDIVGAKGFVFRTKLGEISVHAQEFVLLAKSLRPLPIVKEKMEEGGKKVLYDPFVDKELRYRQRYVDLIVNPAVREVFVKRTKIIKAFRKLLDEHGYLEVETPILQPIYGGASARPFMTHHNTLDLDLYLRIANELYLKRLVIGGFDGVYEFSRDFRNEGMDRIHNPEFTMLELYVAYQDYEWMMNFVEEILPKVALEVSGSTKLKVGNAEIDFGPPWKRSRMLDLIKEYTGVDLEGKDERALEDIARKLRVEVKPTFGAGKIIDEIFKDRVESFLLQPTLVIDFPQEISPLAKKHRSKEGLVERFELIVNGQEICNAFSELNDPLDQCNRFEDQMRLRARGDEEAQLIDEDFVRALE